MAHYKLTSANKAYLRHLLAPTDPIDEKSALLPLAAVQAVITTPEEPGIYHHIIMGFLDTITESAQELLNARTRRIVFKYRNSMACSISGLLMLCGTIYGIWWGANMKPSTEFKYDTLSAMPIFPPNATHPHYKPAPTISDNTDGVSVIVWLSIASVVVLFTTVALAVACCTQSCESIIFFSVNERLQKLVTYLNKILPAEKHIAVPRGTLSSQGYRDLLIEIQQVTKRERAALNQDLKNQKSQPHAEEPSLFQVVVVQPLLDVELLKKICVDLGFQISEQRPKNIPTPSFCKKQ